MMPDATEESDFLDLPTQHPTGQDRQVYHHWLSVPTRWTDTDPYGLVGNVVYYSFFDTVVNDYLIRHSGFDPVNSAVISVVVEAHCEFYSAIAFPQVVDLGLRIVSIHRSTIKYEVGVFRHESGEVAATGRIVHTFVDRHSRHPAAIPGQIRAGFTPLMRTD